jgi:hypothetical protein
MHGETGPPEQVDAGPTVAFSQDGALEETERFNAPSPILNALMVCPWAFEPPST